MSNDYFADPDCLRSPVVGPGHRVASPGRFWARGGSAWPDAQDRPAVAGSVRGHQGGSVGQGWALPAHGGSAATAQGRGRAMRKCGAGWRAGGAAPGERSRPRRPARAPGRSHEGAPLTGRSRPPRAPLRARGAPAGAGGGLERGGSWGGVRVRLAWRASSGERLAPGAPGESGGLLGVSHGQISIGCLARQPSSCKRPGSPAARRRSQQRCQRRQLCCFSPSVSHRPGWMGSPRRPAGVWP